MLCQTHDHSITLFFYTDLPLFFVQTSYTVTESAGSVEVCLSQNDATDVSVAAGVTVEVYLQLTDNTSLSM